MGLLGQLSTQQSRLFSPLPKMDFRTVGKPHRYADNYLKDGYESTYLTIPYFRIKYLFTPEWRNWQTRYVQGVVSTALVRVQISPSAPKTSFIGGLSFQMTNCEKDP